jgi:hypothetical protein
LMLTRQSVALRRDCLYISTSDIMMPKWVSKKLSRETVSKTAASGATGR